MLTYRHATDGMIVLSNGRPFGAIRAHGGLYRFEDENGKPYTPGFRSIEAVKWALADAWRYSAAARSPSGRR